MPLRTPVQQLEAERDSLRRELQDLKRRHRDAQRELDARLQLATEASNTGIWDWNLQTNEVFYSDIWKRQLGHAADELDDGFETWRSRVHPDDLPAVMRRLESCYQPPWQRYESEFRLRHKDGSYRWILARADTIRDEDGRPVRLLGTHSDFTERKSAEAALLRSEARFRAVIEASPVPYALVDAGGCINYFNPAFTASFGYVVGEVPTREIFMQMAYPEPHYRGWVMQTWRRHMDDVAREGGAFEPLEVQLTCKDRSRRTVLAMTADLDRAFEGLRLTCFIDVTEQRLLERSLLEASTREQHQLGMNLHDGLGQELTGLSLLLAALARRPPQTPPAEIMKEISMVAEVAKKALLTARSIAHGLSPIEPGLAGLVMAIRRLADSARITGGLATTVTVAGAVNDHFVDHATIESMYRIAQEAVTNTVKHAGATTLNIAVDYGFPNVTVAVTDDGCGLAAATPSGGLGLKIMRYRARALGGHIEFEHAPGGGTIVRCTCRALREPTVRTA